MKIQSSVCFFFLTGRFNERITFFVWTRAYLQNMLLYMNVYMYMNIYMCIFIYIYICVYVYETNMLGNRKTKGIQKSTHRFLF